MNEPMSTERLAEISASYAAATPGPWQFYTSVGPNFLGTEHHGYLRGIGQLEFGEGDSADKDRRFVLDSHAFVAELLDEVERLRGACNTTDFTCLSGEYCDGCQKRDQDEHAIEFERDTLRTTQAEHETELVEIEQEQGERAASLIEAVEQLHNQAHGTRVGMYMCPAEPCRGLCRHLPNPAEVGAS